jgi:DNA-binding MarR family transcriptional regulator
VPHRLGKLFRVMARVYNKALAPFEVSSVQAHILATLWLGGPLTVGELQARLMLGSSTLTGAIDRMERAGLIVRAPVAGDRRSFMLTPVAWPERRREALLDTRRRRRMTSSPR